MMRSTPGPVLLLGARSDIGRALAHAYADAGCDLILAARKAAMLADDCADLALRYGVKARTIEFDVLDPKPEGFFDALGEIPGTVVMIVGLLGDQAESDAEPAKAALVMRTNFEGPALYLLAAARVLEAAGQGAIIGISSVAGERGRASNFVYGSAKAGFTAFLSGLRNRLAKHGVPVLTVKPGFVATRMTEGMDLPRLLTAQPGKVASRVIAAQRRGRHVIYVPSVWRLIMFVIRSIPESIFRRLSL